MRKYKYLHIMADNYRTNQEFYDFFENNFDIADHAFLIYRNKSMAGDNGLNYLKQENVFRVEDSILNAIKLVRGSERILIHGYSSKACLTLYGIAGALKKSVIIPWGGEFIDPSIQIGSLKKNISYALRKKFFKDISEVAFIDVDQRNRIEEIYNIRIKKASTIHYYDEKEHTIMQTLQKQTVRSDDAINILLCNNAQVTNMHLEALDKLAKYKSENIKVHIFLSTGGTEKYKQEVESYANKLFGDKAIIYRELMSQEKYYAVLSKMDIAVFSNTRLQGSFTCYAIVYAGCKVYCRRGNVTNEALSDSFGCVIYDYQDVGNIPFSELVKYDEKIREFNHTRIAETVFSKDYAVAAWKKELDC